MGRPDIPQSILLFHTPYVYPFHTVLRAKITRARGNEAAAKIDSQKEAEERVRRAEIEAEADK